MKFNGLYLKLIIILVIFLHGRSTKATILLYEPFDYPVGVLSGQGGSETGFDAGSSWSYSGPQVVDVLAAGITFGELSLAGNMGRNSSLNEDNEIGEVLRPIDFEVTSGDVWMSYLYRANAGATASGRGMGILDAGSGSTRSFAAFPKRNGTSGPGSLTYGASVLNSGVGLPGNTDYLIVSRWEQVNSGSGNATMWFVDLSEFSAFDDDGFILESELNTIAPERITTLTESGTPFISSSGTFQIAVVDTSASTRHAWWFDEIRVGTSLTDVTPLNNTVPEPSTLALCLAGILLIRYGRPHETA